MMWAWAYLAGWAVTTVLVCRACWLDMDPVDRDESPGIARTLSLAAGMGAGLVWPVWWVGVALRPVLWPETNPDLDAAYVEFTEQAETHDRDP